jgi:thioredoxin reductase
MESLYDTLIVGGGPSGLTAALHLAWHDRKVLVIDRVTGPLFFTLEKLCNVPGMPGASGVEIQKRLRAQAPKSQRGDTNVPGVWIAGDLRPMTQQVAVAMGTGNIAALMIDQHLRRQDVA